MDKKLEWLESSFGQIPRLNGKQLAARKDPKTEAKNWVSRLDIQRDNLVIFGHGAGFHLGELSSLYPEKNICVYEPLEELIGINGFQFSSYSDFNEIFRIANTDMNSNFQVIFHPASYAVHKTEFDTKLRELTGRTLNSLEKISHLKNIELRISPEIKQDLKLDRDIFGVMSLEQRDVARDFYYINKMVSEVLK